MRTIAVLLVLARSPGRKLPRRCEQTAQVIRNNVSQPPNTAATYEDLGKMTLVNYNAGSGCLGVAIQDAWTTVNSIAWDVLSNHFTDVCAPARDYVNDLSR